MRSKWKPVRSGRGTILRRTDPGESSGERYCFEKGALKSSGTPGFADVWKKGHFAFEYKKKKKSLGEALKQLSQYAWNLENPPLNVVCDTNAIRIVTAWTNTPSLTFDLTLDDLADPEKFAILHAVFHDPEKLRGHMTREMLTKEAADKFSGLAERLQSRGHPPEAVAHFIMQLVFCFFAEDVKLLPEGFFRKALKQLNIGNRHEHAKAMLDDMFSAMATKGGRVGNEFIAYFNGGLFDGQAALPLDEGDLGLLVAVGSMRWAEIDPSIFGTLFERFLDPAKRAQIGAHYTDAKKILQIVDPVVMRPLEAEWAEVKEQIEKLVSLAHEKGPRAKEWAKAEEERGRFVERLASLRILDPACGSGNFLYMALQRVKDLEFRVNNECEKLGLKALAPRAGPEILHGIEINRLAAEIARTTIWIGDIQWGLRHALYTRPEPVLRKLDQIECRDAVLTPRPDGSFGEAQWPEVDFIIGNPPFLGDRRMIARLGEDYVTSLREYMRIVFPADPILSVIGLLKRLRAFEGRQRSRATTDLGNNPTLRFVTTTAKIFEAWNDEPWIIDGAAVRVALICFTNHDSNETLRLNGSTVETIGVDLTEANEAGIARALAENRNVSFIGTQKNGPFDVPGDLARSWLNMPVNPNGKSNTEVVRPWTNGSGIVRRNEDRWIIDFGAEMSETEASLFEAPFGHVAKFVKPTRLQLRRQWHRTKWWLHGDPRPALRRSLKHLSRYVATPLVAKHRVFIWLPPIKIPENTVIVIARDDDTTFGILHSRFHEAWSLRLGTWLGVGNDPRYTPTTTFETFPFPEGLTPNIPAADYAADPRAHPHRECRKKAR